MQIENLSHHFLSIILITMGVLSTNSGIEPNEKRDTAKGPGLADNPLVAEWSGPYGGVPPFDKV
ncbi:MAG: hypothetical protein M3Y60_01895, partial [Bacteroidota bacterium]|nr:hypothetical protein [Bacteroidota bacterium]